MVVLNLDNKETINLRWILQDYLDSIKRYSINVDLWYENNIKDFLVLLSNK